MVWRDALELLDRAAGAELENGAGPQRPLEVGPEDWRALSDGHFFEKDSAAPAVADDSVSVRCTHVPDPLRVIAKHRHQVASAFVVGG